MRKKTRQLEARVVDKVERKALTTETRTLLVRLVWPYRWQLLAGVLVLLVTTLAMLALPQFVRGMFDAALKTGNRHELAYLALGMMGMVILMMAGSFLRARLIQETAMRTIMDVRKHLTQHILRLDVAFYEKTMSGELMSRLTHDTGQLREFIQFGLPMLLRGSLLTLGSFLALILTNMSLAGILLAACLPLLFIGKFFGRKVRALARMQTDNIAAWEAMLGEMIGHVRTVYAFNRQPYFARTSDGLIDCLQETGRRQIYASAWMMVLNVAVGFTALIGVIWLGGVQVMDGAFTLGGMMAFLLYLGILIEGVSSLANFWPLWQSTLGSVEKISKLLKQAPAIVDAVDAVRLPESDAGRALTLNKVSYVYPTRMDDKALDGVDLQVKAGEKVAVVGPSGAGKSTLFRLLQRFDDVTDGAVLLDGVDVRKLKVADVRGSFALVAQDSPMLSGSIYDNVAFGVAVDGPDDGERVSDAAVWQALEMAHAADFVRDLADGLATKVGERGVALSGGQRQRLALARAILMDAPVLLLDEATSHLDSESEKVVQQALERASKGRTVITIAHRLSTVRAAERIFVMDKGRVVATGTHESLMAECPLYGRLAQGQFE